MCQGWSVTPQALGASLLDSANSRDDHEDSVSSLLRLSSDLDQGFVNPSLATGESRRVVPEKLGDPSFLADYGVDRAYVAGGMAKGIASVGLVTRMGKARLLSFFGSGGLTLEEIEHAIRKIQSELTTEEPYGVNFLHNLLSPEEENRLVDVLLKLKATRIEAAAFIQLTPALIRYRVTGLRRDTTGRVRPRNRLLAKVSRMEVAARFLAPPDPRIVQGVRETGGITAEEATLAREISMADDICVEADSGGHTDKQVAFALLPTVVRLRDETSSQYPQARHVRIGAAGGLGTPEAIAASFLLGADFVMTGSINQATVEAGTSDLVKDLLTEADVHDFEMVPAGDMFEIGARVQVLKRGLMFPARANRLFEIYRRYGSLEEIEPGLRTEIEERYFGRTFEDVWEETCRHFSVVDPRECEEAQRNPRKKMAMVFRWYFFHSNRLALEGARDRKVDFQIYCGAAMGALNRWLKGTRWASWRARHVDDLAHLLMDGAARLIETRLSSWFTNGTRSVDVKPTGRPEFVEPA